MDTRIIPCNQINTVARRGSLKCHVADCFLPVDVIVTSADGKKFGGHTTLLSQFSNGFLPPASPNEGDGYGPLETLPLDTQGEVVQMLLHFTHHTDLPDLDDLAFDVLAGLAEESEKFLLYHTINLCKIAMKKRSEKSWARNPHDYESENAPAILAYALKHGYMDIADNAANLALDLSVTDFITKARKVDMACGDIVEWVRYHDMHIQCAQKISDWGRDCRDSVIGVHSFDERLCDQWVRIEENVMRTLTRLPALVHEFTRVIDDLLRIPAPDETDECHDPRFDRPVTCPVCIESCRCWVEQVTRFEIVPHIQFSNLPAPK